MIADLDNSENITAEYTDLKEFVLLLLKKRILDNANYHELNRYFSDSFSINCDCSFGTFARTRHLTFRTCKSKKAKFHRALFKE